MEIAAKYLNLLRLRWFFGPITDKELRVSSRRKRYYWLRAVYVILMLFLICRHWFGVQRSFGQVDPSAYMAETAKQICSNIAMLQFLTAHIIALFLLSGVLIEEVNRRTLDVLLITPISGFQIVTGKIFSKLMQVFLLLCLSFPVLAILRIFGGVRWDLIMYSTSIAILGVFFSASLILFLSTIFRKPYSVFFTGTTLIILCYSPCIYWLTELILPGFDMPIPIYRSIALTNPFEMLYFCLREIEGPSGYCGRCISCLRAQPVSLWLLTVHAVFMITVSLLLIFISACRIRKVALKQISPIQKKTAKWLIAGYEFLIKKLPRISRRAKLRDVRGRAVIWKEMHNSLFRSELLRGREIYLLLIASIVIVYTLILSFVLNGGPELFGFIMVLLVISAYLISVFTSASSIVKEKESSSWEILLCTPMSDWEILCGKIAGILRKSCIMWTIVLLFVALGSYAGSFGCAPVILSFITISGIVAFITGTGIYISLISRNVTTAVMIVALLAATMLFGFSGLIWIVLDDYFFYYYFDLFDIMEAAGIVTPLGPLLMAEDGYELMYVVYVIGFAVVNVVIGAIFATLTRKKMRRKIF